MFIQWCIKGIRGRLATDDPTLGIDDDTARAMLDDGEGIICNWWRDVGTISPSARRDKLTAHNLNRHVHDYANFGKETPFISLTAGCVERDAALRLNRIHEAQDVALRFATDWGKHVGYLFHCWVVVGLKPAVEVGSVAEEIRELNTYVSYSDFQLEGEITAKINVPSNQIQSCERWDPIGAGRLRRAKDWPYFNNGFTSPSVLSNIRHFL